MDRKKYRYAREVGILCQKFVLLDFFLKSSVMSCGKLSLIEWGHTKQTQCKQTKSACLSALLYQSWNWTKPNPEPESKPQAEPEPEPKWPERKSIQPELVWSLNPNRKQIQKIPNVNLKYKLGAMNPKTFFFRFVSLVLARTSSRFDNQVWGNMCLENKW